MHERSVDGQEGECGGGGVTTRRRHPSIAWLLSFPNSGTSYTLANTNQVTQRLVATNYNVAGRSVSQHFPMPEQGPFLLNDAAVADLLPDTYILTKTHCAAYCVDCPLRNFLHWSIEAFVDGCRTTKEQRLQQQHDSNNNATTTILHKTMYPAAWVKRAVHLVRNPFDNLVARMHLSLRDQQDSATTDNEDNNTVQSPAMEGLSKDTWTRECAAIGTTPLSIL